MDRNGATVDLAATAAALPAAPPATLPDQEPGATVPTVGRRHLLTRLAQELASPGPIGLRGERGVGRTRLLAELAQRHTGPLLYSLPAVTSTQVRSAAEGGQPLLVLIDDAEGLGRLEVARLHALASLPGCRVVATVAQDAAGPHSLGPWWVGEGWRCLRVAPLDRTATGDLAAALLGGPPEPRLVHELWLATGGNPRSIQTLVRDAHECGAVTPAADSWRLSAPLPVAALARACADRLAGLSSQALHDLQVLALVGSLPIRAAASLVRPQGVRELESRGLVRFRTGPDGRRVCIADASLAAVVRRGLDDGTRTALLTAVADVLDRHAPTGVVGLDLAGWRLQVGGWSPDRYAMAARQARVAGATVRSHDLASAAVATSGDPGAARLAALAAAERCAGAPVEPRAGTTLESPCAALAATTHDLPALAAPTDADALLVTCHGLAVGGGRWADAATRARTALPGIDADRRGEVAGYAAFLTVLGGDPRGAARLLAEGEEADPSTAVEPLAVAAHALLAAAKGDQEGVRCAVERGRALLAEGPPLVLPMMDDLLRGLDLLNAHDEPFAERIAEADAEVDRCLRTFGAATGWWYAVDGWLRWEAGDLAGARRHLVSAVLAGRTADPLRLRARLLADLAVLASLIGAVVEAEWRLGQIGADRDLNPAVAHRCEVASLLVAANRRGIAALGGELLELAARAGAGGRILDAAATGHLVVRMGAADGVIREAAAWLTALAPELPEHLAGLLPDHASALAAGDSAALDVVARRFAAAGHILLGAEAAAQADAAGTAARSRALADALAAGCTDATTPALVGCAPVEISPRRRDAAALAMTGMDGRAIADRLAVSVRTVENHLARVYRQVGVAGRQELATLFDVERAPFAATLAPQQM